MYLLKYGYFMGDFYCYFLYTGFAIQLFDRTKFTLHIFGLPIIETGNNWKDIINNKKTILRILNIRIL